MSHKLWINGAWVDSDGGSVVDIQNPANGTKIAEVLNGSRADVDKAVQAANEAFFDGRWSKKTPAERSLAIWNLVRFGSMTTFRLLQRHRMAVSNSLALAKTCLQRQWPIIKSPNM